MDFDQIIVNSNLYNIYDNGFTDTVQGMPLRAAIRCIRFLSASRPNSLRSDSGLGGGSLPAPHYAVLLSIPRLVSVILLSVNVMRKIADMIYRTFPDLFSWSAQYLYMKSPENPDFSWAFYFSKRSTSSWPSSYPASLSCSTNHSSTPSTAFLKESISISCLSVMVTSFLVCQRLMISSSPERLM